MTKKNIIMCLLAICLAHIAFVNEIFASDSNSGVTCETEETDNIYAQIDKTRTETCGICKWRTVKAGWKPSDGIDAKYEYHEASASASVQSCKSHSSYSCTAVLMTGGAICPDDEDGGGSEG